MGGKHFTRVITALHQHPSAQQYVAAAFSSFPTREAFWAQYTSNGRRLSWTQITSRLMQERMERDERQAKAARAEYGDLTVHPEFQYRKANTTRATTSSRGIARVYRRLKGLSAVRRSHNFSST